MIDALRELEASCRARGRSKEAHDARRDREYWEGCYEDAQRRSLGVNDR